MIPTFFFSRQLPAESELFSQVIAMWKEIMLKIQNRLDALGIATSTGVLGTLKDCNVSLEYIKKSLEVTPWRSSRGEPFHSHHAVQHPGGRFSVLRQLPDSISSSRHPQGS